MNSDLLLNMNPEPRKIRKILTWKIESDLKIKKNTDVENCESGKGFGFIYIYIDDKKLLKMLSKKIFFFFFLIKKNY